MYDLVIELLSNCNEFGLLIREGTIKLTTLPHCSKFLLLLVTHPNSFASDVAFRFGLATFIYCS